jgi:hypothetical protein
MRMYRVYIADKFTKWPLASHDVHAWTKWGAKRKIFKYVCEGDISYILVAKPVREI